MHYPSNYVSITELRKQAQGVFAQLKNRAITIMHRQQPMAVFLSIEEFSTISSKMSTPCSSKLPPSIASVPVEVPVEQKITSEKREALWEAFKAF